MRSDTDGLHTLVTLCVCSRLVLRTSCSTAEWMAHDRAEDPGSGGWMAFGTTARLLASHYRRRSTGRGTEGCGVVLSIGCQSATTSPLRRCRQCTKSSKSLLFGRGMDSSFQGLAVLFCIPSPYVSLKKVAICCKKVAKNTICFPLICVAVDRARHK